MVHTVNTFTKINIVLVEKQKEMKEEMEELIERGIFSNQAEITREGIRAILLRYIKK